MRHLRYVFILITIALFANYAHAENPVPEEALSAAKKGFEQYKSLITEENYKVLGFESQDEIQKTVPETPIQEFMVRLDELSEYQPEADPMKLLRGGNEYTFFLILENKVRSSFTVAKVDGKWKAVSFGSANKSRLIVNSIKRSSSEKLPVSSFFLVKVPALYYNFLGYSAEGRLMLIPLLDDRKNDFKAGEAIPAERVFRLLSQIAREVKLP